MENKSGIVTISLPFTTGIVAAAIARVPYAGALCSSIAAVLLIYMCAKDGRRHSATMAALFFCIGFMCWCTKALCPSFPATAPSAAMDALEARIDAAGFPGGHSAAILKALLTGRRSLLDPATVRAFRSSGASHILALSGLHLGVLYVFIRRLLAVLGNSRLAEICKSLITIATSLFYAMATGASPSIVRALLFIMISEAGRFCTGRRRSPLGTFCTALTLQLALRPDYISSAGFQLSYLAMLGITTVFPKLEAWYPSTRRPSPMRYIWKCAALSISCQLFTAPAAWIHFHSFPQYFLITNLIAMPLTEMTITFAAAALLLDSIGIRPQLLIQICGYLIQGLEYSLETIASI